MDPYISNHQFNKIHHKMTYIESLLKYNSDPVIIAAAKEIAQDDIESLFEALSGEEKELLQMEHLSDGHEVKHYLEALETYSYGMPLLTDGQIKKLFSKEKKLKLPSHQVRNQRHTYLGWHDEGKKKLYIAYATDHGLLGMVGIVTTSDVNNTSMCTVCGHMNDHREVVNVTVQLNKNSLNNYHTIGFNICKNSLACNQRLEDPSRLERLLNKVNK